MESKNLSNLRPNRGANVKKKRLGRGTGSGLGKTSARGGKGQTARKGGGIRPGFEGGQTPLYRRLPKRGFQPLDKATFQVINIARLEKIATDKELTLDALKQLRLIRNTSTPVKLIGNAKLSKSFKVQAHKASKGATAAIEAAGGALSILKKEETT